MALYSIVVLVVGGLVLLRILYALHASNRRRVRLARDRVGWHAIRTDGQSSEEVPSSAAVDEALERIGKQFSVSRRWVVPIVVVGTAALAGLPYLQQVPAAVLSVIVGGVTLVAGIAARPVIENAVAGLMISHSRAINIGDTVRLAGQYGTIEDISATHTTLKSWNWNRYLVPNGKMLSIECENLSLTDALIWTHVEFVVGYDADLTEVEAIARDAVESSEFSESERPPTLWYSDLKPEGVVIWIAGWARTPSDAWSLQSDIRRGLVQCFQEHQIPIHAHRLQLEELPRLRSRAGPPGEQAAG